MDVRDTLSKGDTPMCQIWYAHVKQKKKKRLKAGNKSAQIDRQGDNYIPPWKYSFLLIFILTVFLQKLETVIKSLCTHVTKDGGVGRKQGPGDSVEIPSR